MPPAINSHDYIRLFGFHGTLPFIVGYEFVSAAGKLDYLAFGDECSWISYMRKEAAEQAGEEGLAIYSDLHTYANFKAGLHSSFARLNKAVENVQRAPALTPEQLKQIFELFAGYRFYYTKTEFFYTDKAFQMRESIPAIQENFLTFEQLKLDGRSYLNKALLRPDSFLMQILEKLSKQFSIPRQELESYTIEELQGIFQGKKLASTVISDRSRYLIYREAQNIHIVTGDKARDIINIIAQPHTPTHIQGVSASKGSITALARVIGVNPQEYDKVRDAIEEMQYGEVLVVETTEPSIILACKKASAIVTNQGGMMSHAAITAREMKIPCIVGTGNATELINTGDLVEVDANKGVVKIIEKV